MRETAGAPIRFLVHSLLIQGVAIGCAVATVPHLETIVVPLFLYCGIVMAFGAFLSLSSSWLVVNLLIGPAILVTLGVPNANYLFMILFLAAAALHLQAFWTRVPYYPTDPKVYGIIARDLPPQGPFVFLDLGCGFGGLLLYLAQKFPEGRFVGVEIGVLSYLIARIRVFFFRRGRISVRFQSMWSVDLSSYDVVYAFLSPAPMPRMEEKIVREMRPGTKFMSNSFPLPMTASYEVQLAVGRQTALYVYLVGGGP